MSDQPALPTLKLTMIRHGEVSLPSKDILYGAHDVNLSQAALVLMPRVAAALAALRPELVLTSPLKRCASLARAVADLSGARLKRDPMLKERSIGEWVLKTRGELQHLDAYQSWAKGDPDVQPTGGESLRMVQTRVLKAALDALGGGFGGSGDGRAVDGARVLERVVWVSHGGVIRGWRCFVNGLDLAESLKYAVSYFGTCEFERDSGGKWSEVRGEHQVI